MINKNFKEQFKGTTFDGAEFTFKINGVVQSLAGFQLKCEFKKVKTGISAKTLTIGNGITITDAAAGKFKIDAFKIELEPALYHYDILFTWPVTNRDKIYVWGTLPVTQNVTNK